uniref:Uncharacterized protein n=3 Tax=Talaromyces marneffei TaxID=37727 RepID=A0A093UZV4_TALMA
MPEKTNRAFSTLEVVPPSNLEHYKRASEVRRTFCPSWMSFGQGANDGREPPFTGSGSDVPITMPPENNRSATRITICGMPQRVFWIVFGVIASLLAIGVIVGGAVGGTRKSAAPAVTTVTAAPEAAASTLSTVAPTPTVTAVVTVTYTPTKTTTSSTTSESSTSSATFATAVTTTAVCVGGTGQGNYVGLCSFACNYGYCPAGPCTCTSSGAPLPTPPTTGVNGIPLAGEDASYLGLCSFCCNHGYCPSSACTTSSS